MPRVGAGRPAFTLLETVLAAVIGSLVLGAAISIMLAMNRSEQAMGRASRHMEELALTQQVLRKSMMSMVLVAQDDLEQVREQAQQDGEITPAEQADLPRPRILLEFDDAPSLAPMVRNARIDEAELFDPAGYGAGPQRLEIVLPDKPVPESMRLFPPAWTTEPSDDLVRAFDPSGVQRPETESGVRGVFELRPDGARERVMEGYGLVPATGLEIPPATPAARRPAEGWTLWWRPVYGEEYQARQRGQSFDIDARPGLLGEAVPLIRGIVSLRWTAFSAEENPDEDAPALIERWPEYEGWTYEDVPGYVELEIETTSGAYASWLFEMGWSLAEESLVGDERTTGEDDDRDEQAPAPDGGDGPGGGDGGESGRDRPSRLGGRT